MRLLKANIIIGVQYKYSVYFILYKYLFHFLNSVNTYREIHPNKFKFKFK